MGTPTFLLLAFMLLARREGLLGTRVNDSSKALVEPSSNVTWSWEDPQRSLHAFLLRKAEDAKDVIRHGHARSHIPTLDPFRLEPLRMLMQEPEGFVNITLRKTTVTGLGDFSVKDVASNLEAGQASVLMSYPKIKVMGTYKMKGFLNSPLNQRVSDEGQFQAIIHQGGATWATYLSPLNADEVRVTQTDVRIFFDDVSHSFKSFGKPSGDAAELLETAAAAILEKVQNVLEENLGSAFSVSLAKSSWTPPLKTDLMTAIHSHSKHLMRKRQVPCENGEELDEYVQTLLSFASRIVRLMEPIGFPNMTAWIDNQLMVFFYNGRASGVSTISSRKPPYVFCPNNTITLGMVTGFKELKILASYRVLQDYQLLLFNGEAEIRVDDPVAFVQLTQVTLEDDTKQSLDRLKIWSIGKISILLKGLGNLTRAVGMLLSQSINQNPTPFVNLIEGQLTTMLRQQLANISVPLFSLI